MRAKLSGAKLSLCAAAIAMRVLVLLAVALRTTSLRVSRRRLAVAAPAPLATLASPAVASDARTYARQGMTAFEKGDVEESIKLFDAAEEADPRYATRLWQRGLSYYCLLYTSPSPRDS